MSLSPRTSYILGRVLMYATLIAAVIIVLFPVYWMLTMSVKPPREILRSPSLWPQTFTLENFRVVLYDEGLLINIRNSLIVSICVTMISVFIASFAAYSILRFRYRFRGLIGRLILFAYLTPTSLLFIPLAALMAQLGLGNSIFGLIIVYLTFALPVSTWLLQSYFRSVPRELEEQAMIDGLSRIGALIRIVLPLSAPGIAAVSIFTFTGAWNELLLALVLITDADKQVVPVALSQMIASDLPPWGPLMAGAALSSVPLMILYFVAQRFMVQGLTGGGVKG